MILFISCLIYKKAKKEFYKGFLILGFSFFLRAPFKQLIVVTRRNEVTFKRGFFLSFHSREIVFA